MGADGSRMDEKRAGQKNGLAVSDLQAVESKTSLGD
jgi:hypothetical protein